MTEEGKRKAILLAMLIGIPCGFYQLYAMNFGPKTDDSAIVRSASKLDEFSAMRAGMAKKEDVGRDSIEEIAAGPSSSVSPQMPPVPAPTSASPQVPPARTPTSVSPTEICNQNDRLFDNDNCKSASPTVARIDDAGSKVDPVADRTDPPQTNENQGVAVRADAPRARHTTQTGNSGLSEEARKLLAWKSLTSAKPFILQGMSKTYPGPVIRAGCRVLAQIEDELRVSRGDDHLLTLTVKGPMPGCKLPNVSGIRLVALAKLNVTENRICARVTQCSDESIERKSVSCSARVKSITGYDCLEGEVYDVSGWGNVIDAAIVIGTAPTVGHLTQSAAQAKTLWTAESAAMTAETLQKATTRVADKVQKAFDGREIRLAQNAFVIVTFEQDSAI